MATGNIACQTTNAAPLPSSAQRGTPMPHSLTKLSSARTIDHGVATPMQQPHQAVPRTAMTAPESLPGASRYRDRDVRHPNGNHSFPLPEQPANPLHANTPQRPATGGVSYSHVAASALHGDKSAGKAASHPTNTQVTSPWIFPPWKRHTEPRDTVQQRDGDVKLPPSKTNTAPGWSAVSSDYVDALRQGNGAWDAAAVELPWTSSSVSDAADVDRYDTLSVGSDRNVPSSSVSVDGGPSRRNKHNGHSQRRRLSWTHAAPADLLAASASSATLSTRSDIYPVTATASSNTKSTASQRRRSHTAATPGPPARPSGGDIHQNPANTRSTAKPNHSVSTADLERRLGKVSLSANAAPFEPSGGVVPVPIALPITPLSSPALASARQWNSRAPDQSIVQQPLSATTASSSLSSLHQTPVATSYAAVSAYHRSEPLISHNGATRSHPTITSSSPQSTVSAPAYQRRNSPAAHHGRNGRSNGNSRHKGGNGGSSYHTPIHGISGLLMTPMRPQVDGHSQTDLAFEYHPAYAIRNPSPRAGDEAVMPDIAATVPTISAQMGAVQDVLARRTYSAHSIHGGREVAYDDSDDSVLLEGQDDASYAATGGWILSEMLPKRLTTAVDL